MHNRAQRISYLAIMMALGVVLTRVASFRLPIGGIEGIRIGFGAVPLILAGVVFGPAEGFVVGALSDIVGYFINPMGQYMPHFTLTAALTGALPALLLKTLANGRRPDAIRLATAILFGQTITSLVLVPYFLQQLFGIPIAPLFIPRLLTVLIQVPVYTFLIDSLIRRSGLLGQRSG